MEPASAALGIITFGAELGVTVFKLRKLWSQIKEFPDDIKELLEELEETSLQLKDGGRMLEPSDSATRCLQRCDRAHRDLEKMVKELEAKLQRKGKTKQKIVALRAILDKEVLEKFQKRLQASQSVFFLALQLSTRTNSMKLIGLVETEMVNSEKRFVEQTESVQQANLMLETISATQASDSATLQQILQLMHTETMRNAIRSAGSRSVNPALDNHRSLSGLTVTDDKQEGQSPTSSEVVRQYSRADGNRRLVEYFFGRFKAEYDTSGRGWSLQLRTPKWWSGAIHELSFRPQLSTYTFRTYNVISLDSEILRSIRTGDETKVRQLFQTRKASPYDVDEEGESLLHYAARHNEPQICKLLLQNGLGDTLYKPIGPSRSTPLRRISFIDRVRKGEQPRNERRDKVVEIFQCYLRSNDDLPLEMVFDYILEIEHNDRHMHIFQKTFMEGLYERPVSERAESIRMGIFADMFHCSSLRRLLSETGQATPTDVALSTAAKASLLHSAAVCLGRRFGEKATPFKKPFVYLHFYTSDWSDWIKDLAENASSADLHAIETVTPPDLYGQVPQWTGTPLISLIGGLFCWLFPRWRVGCWEHAIQSTMRKWLELLHASGVDLSEYGKLEREILHGELGNCKGAFDAVSSRASLTVVRPILAQGSWRWQYEPDHGGCQNLDKWRPIRLLDIAYGPEPEDWSLIWTIEFEYLAYEFWQLVETSELVIPGAWIEE